MPPARSIFQDGSSTVYPITDAVAAEFHKTRGSATNLAVGIWGATGGLREFCRGETDISDASRPIFNKEMLER
jgi:phosphate transport system substrate-binding protein